MNAIALPRMPHHDIWKDIEREKRLGPIIEKMFMTLLTTNWLIKIDKDSVKKRLILFSQET